MFRGASWPFLAANAAVGAAVNDVVEVFPVPGGRRSGTTGTPTFFAFAAPMSVVVEGPREHIAITENILVHSSRRSITCRIWKGKMLSANASVVFGCTIGH